ncbi:hypothetical protein P43SY_006353 [Pythium insidiosum]|uniref:Uncharacterized protein n=1 Tax=Pythium insidiosum TaxID=114742 RepID=A0AAD5LHF0_PYTIN|nr:hypothetical protein P43SY_006353 [Pythium insidiosum]
MATTATPPRAQQQHSPRGEDDDEERDAAVLEDFSASSDDDTAHGGAGEQLDRSMMNELLLVCSNLGMLRVDPEGDGGAIVFKILDAQGTIKVLTRRKAHMDEKRKRDAQKKSGGDGEGDDDEEDDDEEESERRAQLLLEMQRKEADFDVRRYFQSILSHETVQMYCHVLAQYRTNTSKVNHYIHSFFFRAKHFRIQKDDEWTMQPMLFNIRVLMLFNSILQDTQIQRLEG